METAICSPRIIEIFDDAFCVCFALIKAGKTFLDINWMKGFFCVYFNRQQVCDKLTRRQKLRSQSTGHRDSCSLSWSTRYKCKYHIACKNISCSCKSSDSCRLWGLFLGLMEWVLPSRLCKLSLWLFQGLLAKLDKELGLNWTEVESSRR